MKKQIIAASLVFNFIASLFILYSFAPRLKNTNEGSGNYLIMRVIEGSIAELSVSDGNSVLTTVELQPTLGIDMKKWKDIYRLNNQTVTKRLNDLKSQGYELVSSNGGENIKNYVFVKR